MVVCWNNHFPVLKMWFIGSLVVHPWFIHEIGSFINSSESSMKSMTFHLVKIIQSKQVFFSMDGKPSASAGFQYLAKWKGIFHQPPIFAWKVRRGSPTRTHQIDGGAEIFSYPPTGPEGPTYSHRNRLKRVESNRGYVSYQEGMPLEELSDVQKKTRTLEPFDPGCEK